MEKARFAALIMAIGSAGCGVGVESVEDQTGAATNAATAPYPVNWNASSAIASGVLQPGTPPAGANPSTCVLTSLHPYPIILVHGTFGNQNDNWQAIAPTLANAGYCVYTFTYGQTLASGGLGAVADIKSSAGQLASFVGKVRSQTGASQIVFVGHSQGGMLPRYYDKYNGGTPYTHQIIALAPSNNYTSASGLGSLALLFPGADLLLWALCPSCSEQISSSWYASTVDSSPETYSSIQYTNIATTHDEVITPYTQAFLPAASNVVNVRVQDTCPNDPVGHVGLAYDPDVARMILNALTPSQAQPVTCSSGWEL